MSRPDGPGSCPACFAVGSAAGWLPTLTTRHFCVCFPLLQLSPSAQVLLALHVGRLSGRVVGSTLLYAPHGV